MTASARLFAVTVDCPDPESLAEFYRAFLGGETWSTNPDFDDLTDAEHLLLGLGATMASHQPGGSSFRVLVDPSGHPFCITAGKG